MILVNKLNYKTIKKNTTRNVHGGSIMRFMTDSAGALAAKRYAGQLGEVALVSLRSMEFLEPMYVGEIARIKARGFFNLFFIFL